MSPDRLPPDFHDEPLTALDEQTLRASDAIIAISADAIITIDDEQRIIRFNRGAEEIFGYAQSEILGEKSYARLEDIPFPESSGATLIVRGNNLIPPKPATTLEIGDHIYVFSKREDFAFIQLLFGRPEEK
jgi:PAS domain-containing protein